MADKILAGTEMEFAATVSAGHQPGEQTLPLTFGDTALVFLKLL